MKTHEIIDKLEKNKITVDQAVEEILQAQVEVEPQKRAKFLKIKVIDGEEGKKINIPPLPLGLVSGLTSFGLLLGAKFSDDEDLKKINRKDLKKLFDELRKHPPFKLVDVLDESDGTKVEIYTK
ncbi:MAG: hypothetical protein SCJ93_14005 [Bacillota bacterium]|nr:hypothetical protein [Bacillota bacterium]